MVFSRNFSLLLTLTHTLTHLKLSLFRVIICIMELTWIGNALVNVSTCQYITQVFLHQVCERHRNSERNEIERLSKIGLSYMQVLSERQWTQCTHSKQYHHLRSLFIQGPMYIKNIEMHRYIHL